MIKLGILAMIFSVALLASIYHPTEAATYQPFESNYKYTKSNSITPSAGHNGWWNYMLTICATDYSLPITEVILQSDVQTVYLGVNKIIPKGECSHYGAVMKASSKNTLGYKVTETPEAVDKLLALKNGKSGLSLPEINRYRFILGFY